MSRMIDTVFCNPVDLRLLRVAIVFFFFSSRRRHTRCSRDWSSDVCSSDLLESKQFAALGRAIRGSVMIMGPMLARFGMCKLPKPGGDKIGRRRMDTHFKIGRASCREKCRSRWSTYQEKNNHINYKGGDLSP